MSGHQKKGTEFLQPTNPPLKWAILFEEIPGSLRAPRNGRQLLDPTPSNSNTKSPRKWTTSNHLGERRTDDVGYQSGPQKSQPVVGWNNSTYNGYNPSYPFIFGHL